jgi:hypothetical protein
MEAAIQYMMVWYFVSNTLKVTANPNAFKVRALQILVMFVLVCFITDSNNHYLQNDIRAVFKRCVHSSVAPCS